MVESGDRRSRRSRSALQHALMDLVATTRFDRITVAQIIERADVGRTTFYKHFESKEDLFLSTHEGLILFFTRSLVGEGGDWPERPTPEMVQFLEMMQASGDMHYYLTWGGTVQRLLQKRLAAALCQTLSAYYRPNECRVPFEVLAQHVAASMVSLMDWWMAQHTPYPPAEFAAMLHEINQASLRAALNPSAKK